MTDFSSGAVVRRRQRVIASKGELRVSTISAAASTANGAASVGDEGRGFEKIAVRSSDGCPEG